MTAEKTITIQYFAALREARGCALETLATRAGTPAALYEELQARFALPLHPKLLRVAVNETFAPMSQPLQEGDRVIFIPPVAGG